MTTEVSVVLNALHARLIATNQTVSVAESCTGGLLGAALTELPGSSCYFLGGIQAYANDVKEGLLGVSHETLVSFGAPNDTRVSWLTPSKPSLTSLA